MPNLFDDEFRATLRQIVIPTLERLAADHDLGDISLPGSEHSVSPPNNPNEPQDLLDEPRIPTSENATPGEGPLPENLGTILERPFNDDERRCVQHEMIGTLNPNFLYRVEARIEKRRLVKHQSQPIMNFMKEEKLPRLGVLIRHNIKRRWEKLGIWNHEWGFPGRNEKLSDKLEQWKWKWEPTDTENLGSSDAENPESRISELFRCAVRLRKNLGRGEKPPMLPLSHLGHDAASFEAQSFLVSRPWFMFELETIEEAERHLRVPYSKRDLIKLTPRDQVIEWWKERGDWKDEYDGNGSAMITPLKQCDANDIDNERVNSWKWRNESPSPEPEDDTPLDEANGLLGAQDLNLTPSEIDALEAIERPEWKRSESFWTYHNIQKGERNIMRCPLPGQLAGGFRSEGLPSESRFGPLTSVIQPKTGFSHPSSESENADTSPGRSMSSPNPPPSLSKTPRSKRLFRPSENKNLATSQKHQGSVKNSSNALQAHPDTTTIDPSLNNTDFFSPRFLHYSNDISDELDQNDSSTNLFGTIVQPRGTKRSASPPNSGPTHPKKRKTSHTTGDLRVRFASPPVTGTMETAGSSGDTSPSEGNLFAGLGSFENEHEHEHETEENGTMGGEADGISVIDFQLRVIETGEEKDGKGDNENEDGDADAWEDIEEEGIEKHEV